MNDFILENTPQECLNDFLNGKYIEKNYIFLMPVYEKLFENIGSDINITADFKKEINNFKNYFSYIEILRKKNRVIFKKGENRRAVVEDFISLIDNNEIDKAAKALGKILEFICNNRTNINGLEIISWSMLGKTTLDNIRNYYVDNEEKKENLKNALLSFDFISLVINYKKDFSNIIINDLLIPVELKSPKRRQGFFDKEVFRLIAVEIKKDINGFSFEEEMKDKSEVFLRSNTDWIITEKTTKKIKFPLPEKAKKIDVICKIENSLFVGTHKEQQSGGGAQDNQAVDASFLFNYTDSDLKEIKEIFNVKYVYLCIFLERGREKITSSHWKNILDIVDDKDNTNKYLLSSAQFIDLIRRSLKK